MSALIREVRKKNTGLPVLHIGNSVPATLRADVPALDEDFTSVTLLQTVES